MRTAHKQRWKPTENRVQYNENQRNNSNNKVRKMKSERKKNIPIIVCIKRHGSAASSRRNATTTNNTTWNNRKTTKRINYDGFIQFIHIWRMHKIVQNNNRVPENETSNTKRNENKCEDRREKSTPLKHHNNDYINKPCNNKKCRQPFFFTTYT